MIPSHSPKRQSAAPWLFPHMAVFCALLGLANLRGAGPTPDPVTGTYYEFIEALLTWDEARTNAAARSFSGAKGHLVTLQSFRENLIVQHLGGLAEKMIGLTDSTATSELDGFPAGALGTFEAGDTSDLPLPAEGRVPVLGERGAGFRWITGEPVDWQHWRQGAPGGSPLGNDGVYTIVQGVWQDVAAGVSLGEPGGGSPRRKSVVEYGITLPQERFRMSERHAGPEFGGNGSLPTLAAAEWLLALTEDHPDVAETFRGEVYTISFQDPDLGGGVETLVRSPFLGDTPGINENRFAVRFSAQVFVPAAGEWTFAVASGGRFRLRVGGNEFEGDGLQPGTPPRLSRAGAPGVTMTAAPGGSGETFYFAEPGAYDLFLTTLDSGFFAYIQLLAAPGNRTAFDLDQFDLVGDELNGGLRALCPPADSTPVVLAAEALPEARVRLTWNGSPCARYRVERAEAIGGRWTPVHRGIHPGGPLVDVEQAAGGSEAYFRVVSDD